ncbi:hypothetical protein GCM10011613_21440 [Cellvibrio zantedeschiae]|uniref:Uncharacterized protein n=1 Tax=Cellvibrio zantedeschiae TaxID=1237077 RepID=A0ABQ3B2U7_9GAMM|nr:hypothetical protein [Cellvibrio zantedeschiae]GGY76656.1 hypothetical protein GCM10011613_21440 [Cellvibrio zantedeschiae]
MDTPTITLDQHREEFSQRRYLAVPLAGTLCWLVAGIINIFVTPQVAALVLFIATGSIVYMGMLLSRVTGEDFFRKSKPKNPFDNLFLRCVAMALLVYSIGIPFFMVDPRSLPLSLGILTGLMWLPFSWIIQHWVGTFHVLSRTILIVAAWYLFPQHSFVAIPAVIIGVYAVTIFILENRWRKINNLQAAHKIITNE